MATEVELRIAQFRYYGNGNENNYPLNDISWFGGSDNVTTYDLLKNLGPAVKIGIQTLPGVRFFLNNNSDSIIIDHTGIYELDVRDITTTISSLKFDVSSLNLISEVDNASLIVDIMYKKTDGAVTN